jgi:hypothetical protein
MKRSCRRGKRSCNPSEKLWRTSARGVRVRERPTWVRRTFSSECYSPYWAGVVLVSSCWSPLCGPEGCLLGAGAFEGLSTAFLFLCVFQHQAHFPPPLPAPPLPSPTPHTPTPCSNLNCCCNPGILWRAAPCQRWRPHLQRGAKVKVASRAPLGGCRRRQPSRAPRARGKRARRAQTVGTVTILPARSLACSPSPPPSRARCAATSWRA